MNTQLCSFVNDFFDLNQPQRKETVLRGFIFPNIILRLKTIYQRQKKRVQRVRFLKN